MRDGLAGNDTLNLLLKQAVAGDSSARRDLIAKYRPLLRLVADRFARRVFRARYDESDVVQITCAEAYKSFGDFRGDSREEFSRWVEVILERNVVRLWHQHHAQKRSVRREVCLDPQIAELSFVWGKGSSSNPQHPAMVGEQALIIAEVLHALPDSYREAISLRFIDGLKLAEIAARMGTSVGAVAGYLRRGLETMQQQLPADWGSPDEDRH